MIPLSPSGTPPRLGGEPVTTAASGLQLYYLLLLRAVVCVPRMDADDNANIR
jgi:hypothetical protein